MRAQFTADLSISKYLLVVKKEDDGRYSTEFNLDGTSIIKIYFTHEQIAELEAAIHNQA